MDQNSIETKPDSKNSVMASESNSSTLSFENFPFLSPEIATSTFLLPYTENEELLEHLRIDMAIGKELQPWVNWAPPGYQAGELSTLKCRLYPLQTVGDGNCLLHACLLSMVGSHDKEQMLRNLLALALVEDTFANHFKQIWMASEKATDATFGEASVQREEEQFHQEWEGVLSTTLKSGEFLGAFHIYMLAHILKRPIIVYGDAYIRGPRGERYSPNTLRGIFLPNQLPSTVTHKVPIVIGYTIPCAGRAGHFTALVGMEDDLQTVMLVDEHGLDLPFHFLTHSDKFADEQQEKEHYFEEYFYRCDFTTNERKRYSCCSIAEDNKQVRQDPRCADLRLTMIKKAHEKLNQQAKKLLEKATMLKDLYDKQEIKSQRANERLFNHISKSNYSEEHSSRGRKGAKQSSGDSLATGESNRSTTQKDRARSGSLPVSLSRQSQETIIGSSVTTEQNKKKALSFQQGDRVEAQFGGGIRWYPGYVIDVNEGLIHVAYDDGNYDRALKPEHVRLKPAALQLSGTEKTGPDANVTKISEKLNQVKFAESMNDIQANKFTPGDLVRARWGAAKQFYYGKIKSIVGSRLYKVAFDDGEVSEVKESDIRLVSKPLSDDNTAEVTERSNKTSLSESSSAFQANELKLGDIVSARWGINWYKGHIEAVIGSGYYKVAFEDNTSKMLEKKLIRLINKAEDNCSSDTVANYTTAYPSVYKDTAAALASPTFPTARNSVMQTLSGVPSTAGSFGQSGPIKPSKLTEVSQNQDSTASTYFGRTPRWSTDFYSTNMYAGSAYRRPRSSSVDRQYVNSGSSSSHTGSGHRPWK